MPRIVHIGLGNFHRAHQAWYTAHAGDWSITGVIMRNRALYEQLRSHGNAYLLGIWGKDGLETEMISVYDDVLLAADDPASVVSRIADPETHAVTLTVTEKGYHLRPSDGGLDLSDPHIQADLASECPSTPIGLVAAGLEARAARSGAPITILSCDNLADNGRKLASATLDFLEAKNPRAKGWAERHATFPNTMVDRITPRLSTVAIEEITSRHGGSELSVVGTEAFSEWIIEDAFAGARPTWDKAGAVFVDDVRSFEERKLRLLNAAHSYLAYAGQLAEYRYVHEAIADKQLLTGVNALWDEASSTVSPPASASIDRYRAALLDRFMVPEMRHELSQIAMDGSIKLRERILPIIRQRAKANLASPMAERAVQAWAEFVIDAVTDGEILSDPNSAALVSICQHKKEPVDELLKHVGLS